MDESGRGWLFQPTFQFSGQGLHPGQDVGGQPSGVIGGAGHEQQPLLAEEFDPAFGPGVGLMQAADEGVRVQTIRRRGDGMELRQQCCGVGFAAGVEAAASGQQAHEKHVRAAVEDIRNGQCALRGQIMQHPAFFIQRRSRAAIHFGYETPTIRQIHAIDFAHAAAAERADAGGTLAENVGKTLVEVSRHGGVKKKGERMSSPAPRMG